MNINNTPLPGICLIEPKVFQDSRGYFFESYNKRELGLAGLETDFVQDNESISRYGVIRGLHYQLDPHAQTKLIRVLSGRIFDVVVDVRKGSPTFGKWFGTDLTSENKKQLYIPGGFAHGFSVLSEEAVILYKCDAFYHPASEAGIIFNDPTLQIDWKIPMDEISVSSKDAALPSFENADYNFKFTNHDL